MNQEVSQATALEKWMYGSPGQAEFEGLDIQLDRASCGQLERQAGA